MTFDPSPPRVSRQMELFSTSSPEGSPARIFPSPGRAPGSAANDPASGSNTTGSSPKRGRAGFSSRTSQPFALADWKSCSGASLRSGMMRNGTVFPRPPLALATDGIASGWWPTPTVDSASNRSTRYAQGGMPLAAAVKLWPTPTVHGNTNKPVPGTKAGFGLGSAVKAAEVGMFPTPCAQNHRIGMPDRYGPGQRRSMLNDAVAAMMWRTPLAADARGSSGVPKDGKTVQLVDQVRMWPTPLNRDYRYPPASSYEDRGGGAKGEQLPYAVGGALNPTWVEWLQGFPPGWTELPTAA